MRRWLDSAASALEDCQADLNALNVFPVADSDTGTNLAVTVRAGAEAAAMVNTTLIGELFGICAHHCLDEAKGNSGTLLAVMLAGMAEPLAGESRLTALSLAGALEHGKVRVHSALNDPVEGTILSVVNTLADVAASWPSTEDSKKNLAELLTHMVDSARETVRASGEVLPVLRGTGRVDAGALGALIVVDCLAHEVRGEDYPGARARPYGVWLTDEPHDDVGPGPDDHRRRGSEAGREAPSESGTDRETEGPASAVEFMCSIDLDALSAAKVRHELAQVGDSVIMTAMTPGADLIRWKVHVHVPESSVAMAVLGAYGKPLGITTESLSPEAG